jgi:hypothetical protein
MRIPSGNYSIESFYRVLMSRPEEYRMMKILYLNAYFKSWAPLSMDASAISGPLDGGRFMKARLKA